MKRIGKKTKGITKKRMINKAEKRRAKRSNKRSGERLCAALNAKVMEER